MGESVKPSFTSWTRAGEEPHEGDVPTHDLDSSSNPTPTERDMETKKATSKEVLVSIKYIHNIVNLLRSSLQEPPNRTPASLPTIPWYI
jgi:hypothetical protein